MPGPTTAPAVSFRCRFAPATFPRSWLLREPGTGYCEPRDSSIAFIVWKMMYRSRLNDMCLM
jgi:hypothetical protein